MVEVPKEEPKEEEPAVAEEPVAEKPLASLHIPKSLLSTWNNIPEVSKPFTVNPKAIEDHPRGLVVLVSIPWVSPRFYLLTFFFCSVLLVDLQKVTLRKE